MTQLQEVLPFRIDDVYFSDKTNRLIKTRDFDLKGKTIIKIYRKAKWLLFDLAPEGHLISHLGMSGSWQMSEGPLKNKHGHIELIDQTQKNYKVLTYIDPRRFGHFYILNSFKFLEKLNTIPTDISDPSFDENTISELFFRNPNKLLKVFLLDQKAFPGVGNYIASEVCARAKILPTRLCGDINAHEILKIKKAISIVIEGATKSSGTTFGGGYRDAFGEKGEGVNHLVVFHQKTCQLCQKTEVIKTVMAGRGTYHCPNCQK